MDTPEFTYQPPVEPEPQATSAAVVAELEQQCQDLRMLFNATFVALIFLALAVNLFMFKQMRLVQHQIEEQRPVVTRADNEFRKNRDPEIRQFMALLQQYAASHRDFQANILDRYRAVLPQYFNAAAAVQPAAPLTPGTNVLLAPRP